jgi:aspartyl-tRNA(Asn)/glutamyl-tRNA(Gln) amidotransferase subunit A
MPKTNVKPDTLDFATVVELNSLLRERQVSSKELTNHFLERLATIGPQYNAVAAIIEKQALQQTGDIDDDLERERFRGMLQGIPYGAKDLLSVAGYPTTWGAKPFEQQKFDEDAHVIQRLRKAGAVLIGKLAMIELAGGGGYNTAGASLQGPGLNPWNKSYWSGGSSSGSGIAVAAGLVPYALGSETSGSIITPAAYCGVTGLRPTYGLVSRRGAMPLSWTCDKIGVLAHTADDCGHVMRHLAGGDDQDPGSAGKSFYYTPEYSRPIHDLKIGYHPADFEQWPEPAMRPAYQTALNVVRTMGASVVELQTPDLPYGSIIGTIIESEAASAFETFIRGGQLDQLSDPTQANGLKAALNLTAVDYLKAMRLRTQVQRAFREIFINVDVLVAPSTFNLPERADQPFDEQDKNRPPEPAQRGLGKGLVQASNLCGLPALSLPAGFGNGLPLGVQFVGPAFSENTLLGFGRLFQKLTDFHKQHPPGVQAAARAS